MAFRKFEWSVWKLLDCRILHQIPKGFWEPWAAPKPPAVSNEPSLKISAYGPDMYTCIAFYIKPNMNNWEKLCVWVFVWITETISVTRIHSHPMRDLDRLNYCINICWYHKSWRPHCTYQHFLPAFIGWFGLRFGSYNVWPWKF